MDLLPTHNFEISKHHTVFTWKIVAHFGMQQKSFMCISHFTTQNTKETCTQGLICNTTNTIFGYQGLKFLNETGMYFFSSCEFLAAKNAMTIGIVLYNSFDSGKKHEKIYPLLLLHHQ